MIVECTRSPNNLMRICKSIFIKYMYLGVAKGILKLDNLHLVFPPTFLSPPRGLPLHFKVLSAVYIWGSALGQLAAYSHPEFQL